jgi:caa(3)-type oxidase, subunit IV
MNASSHKTASHIVPLKVYLTVSLALVVLTVLSIIISQLNWGGVGTALVLGCATINAMLIAGFFMHLRYDNKFFTNIFLASIIIIGFLLAFVLIDMNSRQGLYENTMQEIKQGANLKEVKQRNEARDKPAQPQGK